MTGLHEELMWEHRIRGRTAMAAALQDALDCLRSSDPKRRDRALITIERVRRTLTAPPLPDLSDVRIEP